jgi:tRNA modification GTPase
MADADIVMVMLDVSEPAAEEDGLILQSSARAEHIIVVNKIDKVDTTQVSGFITLLKDKLDDHTAPIVEVSAKTGDGLADLRSAILEPFAPGDISSGGFLVSDARHHDLLLRTNDEIGHSLELLEQHASEEVILVGLHNALRYLGQITGETTTEDMLTRIFSTFCIGK